MPEKAQQAAEKQQVSAMSILQEMGYTPTEKPTAQVEGSIPKQEGQRTSAMSILQEMGYSPLQEGSQQISGQQQPLTIFSIIHFTL